MLVQGMDIRLINSMLDVFYKIWSVTYLTKGKKLNLNSWSY